MKKFFSRIPAIFSVLTILFLMPKPALADGAIVSPDYYPVYETAQKALIIFQENHEDLVISPVFSGHAGEFGWIVPLPSKPEISKVDSSIFRKLDEATKPKDNLLDKLRGTGDDYYDYSFGFNAILEERATGEETSVEVVEEGSLGVYDYAILTSEDVNDLKDWLDENDFKFPVANSYTNYQEEPDSPDELITNNNPFDTDDSWSQALPIIQDYIDSDWYFVVIKINNEFTNSSGVRKQLSNGSIDPLRFSFDTTDRIYPMKLTGISQRDVSITLYSLDSNKTQVQNYNYSYCTDDDCSIFTTSYSGSISIEDINEITKEIGRDSWFEARDAMVITKLYSNYVSYTYMTEDLLLEQSDDHDGVNDGTMTITEWLILPFVLIFMLPLFMFGGIFVLFGETSLYPFDSISSGVFLGCSITSFIFALTWLFLSILILRKLHRKFFRFLIYITQIPIVWVFSASIAILPAILVGIIVAALGIDESMIMIDGFLAWNLFSVLLILLFYRILWRRKLIEKKQTQKKK